jgi:hypothetical protein
MSDRPPSSLTSEMSDEEFANNAFAELEPFAPSVALQRRIASIPHDFPRVNAAGWAVWVSGWRALMGFGFAGILGVCVGFGTVEQAAAPANPVAVATSGDVDLDGMLTLAWGYDDEDWGEE